MLQILTDGLVIGSVVSLGAIGLSLTFSILRFSNFGHGELLAWGAYFAFTALAVFTAWGWPVAPLAPFSFGWPLLAALAVADRAAVLVEGRERIVASSRELLHDPRMAELYLGRHAAPAGTATAGVS